LDLARREILASKLFTLEEETLILKQLKKHVQTTTMKNTASNVLQ